MSMSKDKRMTLNQFMQALHSAYDDLEVIAVNTAERTLRETFGFGDVRLQRFREKYLEIFGEEAAKYAEETRRKLRRRF